MNTVRMIAKNTVVRTGAEILNLALSAIFLIYVVRHLGSVDFGKYSFAFSFAGFFAILTDIGLHTLFIREAVKEKEKTGKLLGNLLIIKSILALSTFSILFITINLMDYPPETKKLVYIMGIFVMGTSYLDLFNCVFRAFERMAYEALIMSVNRLAIVTSGITALYLGYGLVDFAIAILIANLLTAIPSAFLVFRRFSTPRLKIDIPLWRHLFKEAIPIGLMMLFTTIYLKAGTIILSVLKGDLAVGLYSAPHRLIEALSVFPTFFLAALFPALTRFHQSSSVSLFKAYEVAFKLLLILILPVVAVTTVLADKFVVIIFGKEFMDSAILLGILIWAYLFISLNILLSYLIISAGRQKLNIISFGVSAMVNVILNLILIPSRGYNGAGIAFLVSQTILFVLNFVFVSSSLYKLPLQRMVLKPLFGSLFLGGFVGYIRDANLFFIVLTGFIFYFVILVLMKTFSHEDIITVKSLIKLR
ncbi:MAG: flippase [Nitrospirae bacterium]|nr:flippase [Nitrospirota bacterium]